MDLIPFTQSNKLHVAAALQSNWLQTKSQTYSRRHWDFSLYHLQQPCDLVSLQTWIKIHNKGMNEWMNEVMNFLCVSMYIKHTESNEHIYFILKEGYMYKNSMLNYWRCPITVPQNT
jgi:hypothetical protein